MIDVLIAGAGPVGLAAAIEARLAGLSATVVEPRDAPVDKACGEGLMPGAVRALARIGVHPMGQVLTGVRYAAGDRHVDHGFRHGPGLGVRRTVLHEALAARADELGVERISDRVGSLEQNADSVAACGLRARWLLGCDGLHSSVSALAGLDRPTAEVRRFGLRRHFRIRPWSSMVEVRWLPGAEIYLTPVAADLVGVAVLGPARTAFAEAVAAVPELTGVPAVSALRGAGPMRRRTTARTAGRVLLVGDASGYVDAITGEGIKVGLAQVRAAIAAVVRGDAAGYERDWRITSRDYRLLTGGLLAAATSPLRPAIVPLACRLPRVYGAAVERLAR